ncbi:ABC transporter ATP-binding protein [Nonomuraea zeae]|uniref:ABC transporter ATP-binding protein n=1 Tax=Nonomuraea zeae TaxID=1642303 RepID=A0A5S4G2U7_9ACTN|nr:ABC transporter ATP-binding protein [Nonomuraea zeae]TMR26721.1 ABC transporter ATP-binding protein [Nonomuraea zeae]
MSSTDQTLAATGLTKHFGSREAVSDLTFEVRAGRAFGLLGPNGTGKTTTVRLLTGLLTPTRGSVTLFGQTLSRSNADALRARIGVQTDTRLYENLSVRDNLRTWGQLYGLAPRVIERRIGEVLEVLGLSDRVGSLAGELSKGMRQKLSVGRAVLHEPDLLFLDEPTAGLDPEAAIDLIGYVREMINTLRTTVVICTHQLHGLETLCDDVGILNRGRLAVTGEVRTLLRRRWPEHRYLLEVGGDPASAREVITSAVGRAVEFSTVEGLLSFSLNKQEPISSAVAALVHSHIQVRAVIPRRPTIQDLYFATINDGSAA